MDYCSLWQALIKGDMKGVERHSRSLGAGDLYALFACVLTARSWTSVTAGISSTPVTHSEVGPCRALGGRCANQTKKWNQPKS